MTDSDREYPYVDEHEFNYDYISRRGFNGNQVMEEKPDDLQGEA